MKEAFCSMPALQKDLDLIKVLAAQREKENHRFRIFLKQRDSTRLNHLVDRINAEVANEIDCTECGNCCATLRPFVTEQEIATLSSLVNTSKELFIDRYTKHVAEENARILKDTPCAFLANKKCTVYDARPHDCRSFPHIEGKNFTHRTIGMVEKCGICPIVFNVLERLKRELHFR
jgi:uncharacterized protein